MNFFKNLFNSAAPNMVMVDKEEWEKLKAQHEEMMRVYLNVARTVQANSLRISDLATDVQNIEYALEICDKEIENLREFTTDTDEKFERLEKIVCENVFAEGEGPSWGKSPDLFATTEFPPIKREAGDYPNMMYGDYAKLEEHAAAIVAEKYNGINPCLAVLDEYPYLPRTPIYNPDVVEEAGEVPERAWKALTGYNRYAAIGPWGPRHV